MAQSDPRDEELARLRQENAELRKLVEQLIAENRELRRKVEELSRIGKRQATPFARRNRKERRKRPGRQAGHPGARRAVPCRVDREVRAPLRRCPHCAARVIASREHEQFVVDLPEVTSFVTKIVTESGWCGCCRRRVRSQHPEQISTAGGAAAVALGPRAMGLAAELKHRLGMPYRDIAAVFGSYLGLSLTHSALAHASRRLGRRGERTYEALRQGVRASPVVHSDDTGWRVDGASRWLWVFATTAITLYSIDPRRGAAVVREILGDEFGGILVTDGLPALDTLKFRRAQCLGHLLRRASEMVREQDKGAVRFPRAVRDLLKHVVEIRKRRGLLAPGMWDLHRNSIEYALDWLLASNITHRDNLRLVNHLRAHRDQLLVCLHDERVDPTNNLAERELRGAVVIRKTGGCNRSEGHARGHAVISSVAQTAHRHGSNLAAVVSAWMRPQLAPALPQTLATIIAPAFN